MDNIESLLVGAYDLHTHTNPSHFKRALDDFELLEQADNMRMAGVMIKSHYDSTAARARLINERKTYTNTLAYGGVALNHPVGGLNPFAVESCLNMGGKFIWMPTRDAANSLSSGNMPGDFFKRDGISIIGDDGKLLPVCYDIMDIVKKYDAVLATGHISPNESVILCNIAVDRGVKTVLTHPEFSRTTIPVSVQRELAIKGVFIEKCWYNIREGSCTASEMANHMHLVGIENCFMTTDRGQIGLENPVEGLIMFIKEMLKYEITEDEIIYMIKTNPSRIVL